MVGEQQHPPVTRDFLGLGSIASSAHGQDLAQLEVQGEEGIHGNPYFGASHGWPGAVNGPAGVKHPVWNKSVATQQFFSHRNFLEERYMEGSADSCGLAHTRQWQVPLPGTITKLGGVPGGTQTRVLASDAAAAKLTILYAGNVNVYDDVPVDRAQAIMQMAASSNSWPRNAMNAPPGGSYALAAQGPQQPVNAENLHFNVQIGQTQFVADQASQSSPPANRQFECPTPNTPSSASSHEPVVPRALPLARKASLARFLEKRKERVQMMSPYLKNKSLSLEQSILPGDLTSGFDFCSALFKSYSEYVKRPVPMTFCMEQHMGTGNDMPPCGMPAGE